MKRKLWLAVMISFGILMSGCGEIKSNEIKSEETKSDEMKSEETKSEETKIDETKNEETKNYEIKIDETKTIENVYYAEDYGEIEEYGGEFYFDEENKGFYYYIESFYLNSDFLYTMNDTLEKIYDGYLEQYLETQDWYMEQGKQELPEGNVPYSKLIFQGVKYVDYDYISLLFNDVTYMGGATAYSNLDAVTLDRHTGEEVKASDILLESDSEILQTVNQLMGLDEEADWEDLDFYLEEERIVFFYRMPGVWEDVILGR